MDRRPFVVANWKMNHTRALARAWCANFIETRRAHAWPEEVEVGIAPPFTSLEPVREKLASMGALLGGQNAHWEPAGAFTGEVSPEMLAEAGCRFVILGHSERRHVFGETDERIGRKVAAAREAGLVPLLCVGETESERESDRTAPVIEGQLRRGLARWSPKSAPELVIAYEPVWAIGTGKVAQPAQAQEAQRFLRDALAGLAGATTAGEVRILYGGSVTPANALELARQPDVDGFLVGGASLDANAFHKIILAAGEARGG